jgi:hypothetical protein
MKRTLQRTCVAAVMSMIAVMLFVPLFTRAADMQGPCPNGQTMGQNGCGSFVPLAAFNNSPRLNDIYTDERDLGNFLNKLFMGSIALGGILAVLRLAWAGFVYMSSDLWSSKGHAKEIIQETLLGLFLLLAIWIILNFINPDILKLKVEPATPLPTPAGSGFASPSARN